MDMGDSEKKSDIRRPMNAFLIFCKRHRSMVREKNPDLDNRSVTRILGDLWANLEESEKSVYTSLAKQYKDAFMKANPDYKWHNPEKSHQTPTKMTTRPTNARVVKSVQDLHLDGTIIPGKLADPSKMGGLSLLLMAGQQSMTSRQGLSDAEKHVTSPESKCSSSKSALLELAEMCANELQQEQTPTPAHPKKTLYKMEITKKGKVPIKRQTSSGSMASLKERSRSESDSGSLKNFGFPWKLKQPLADMLKSEITPEQTRPPVSETSSSVDLQGHVTKKIKTEPVGFSSQPDRQPRVRSWSESAMTEGTVGEDLTFVSDKLEEEAPTRRTSQAETIAGCLSDQNDNAIVSCGKLVVDHIVDKFFSTDIAQAVMKKKGVYSVEELKSVLLSSGITDANSLTEDGNSDRKLVQTSIERLVAEIYAKEENGEGTSESLPKKTIPAKELTPTKEFHPILRVPEFKSSREVNETSPKTCSEIESKPQKPTTLALHEPKNEPPDSTEAVTPEAKGDKSDQDIGLEEDGKDRDDAGAYQPVRKSRRRNRGQRYLELINEGIIQPSKERLAARRAEQSSTEEENVWWYEETPMEEEVIEVKRMSHKRLSSDGDSIEEKKYKTGDFDLEAHIATLPACSLEVSRGRRQSTSSKVRHHSEGSTKKTCLALSPTSSAPVDVQTFTLPPHVKLQQEAAPVQPVSGSRKRKVRKHSINHLLPAGVGAEAPGALKVAKESEQTEADKDSSVTAETPDGPSTEKCDTLDGISDQSDSNNLSCDTITSDSQDGSDGKIKDEKTVHVAEDSHQGETLTNDDRSERETESVDDSSVQRSIISSSDERDMISFDRKETITSIEEVRTIHGQSPETSNNTNTQMQFNKSSGKPYLSEESVDSEGQQRSVCDKQSSNNLSESVVRLAEQDALSEVVPSDLSGKDSASLICSSSETVPVDDNVSEKTVKSENEAVASQDKLVFSQESFVSSFSSPTSTVNVVSFASTSSVELMTLTSSAATSPSVSLDVLSERHDDSPSSSITQSPLAAGSPSVAAVHS